MKEGVEIMLSDAKIGGHMAESVQTRTKRIVRNSWRIIRFKK